MAYTGYGKGLYLKGDDGYIYVLAHLNKFSDDIDRTIRRLQIAAERYYLDVYFPDANLFEAPLDVFARRPAAVNPAGKSVRPRRELRQIRQERVLVQLWSSLSRLLIHSLAG